MGWGGCEAPGLRPEVLRFEYRFDEDERFAWSRYPRASGRQWFYHLAGLHSPPTGGPGRRAPVPDRMRNPRMPAGLIADLRRRSFVTTEVSLLRTDRRRFLRSAAAKPSRSSTPESRIGRRTCALPVPSGEEQYASAEQG